MILLTNDSRAIAVYNEISQLIVYLPRSSNGRALLLHGRDGSSILSRGTKLGRLDEWLKSAVC